ncbi:UDP-glucose--hexose-1-phosphate uridylyltransferase [Lacticaseibacillus nasuensis JCM 17158]|uniref:Galactose-1-phosphate uridylyltransferase n=1 Tax=Lacticaseibacillus nasuensis JCM 17158 TaxID=1291734 RepID=A0A0R1JXA5_9LACO|nr:UDP-glucose--hexose-1-phosphate uridylyltransferase [Lacticaseibacillus nasuensis JCM 17158]
MLTTAVDAHVTHILQLNPTYSPLDRVYLTNRVRALCGDASASVPAAADPLTNLDRLVAAAVSAGVIAETHSAQEILGAALMALATPAPSAINAEFWGRYQDSPSAATDYFYALCRANNQVQTRAIAKNIAFTAPSDYGDLEITINLSKPEKDPKDIAAAAKQSAAGYPACALCLENEGYAGRADWAARANHRIVRLSLGGRTWGLQYSPYAYFTEHAIFLDSQHTPMHINAQTFSNLLDLVTLFPHYFVGSNADLPIVGGSMLAHEHYQGGRHTFAMAKAPIATPITLPGYPQVEAGIVKWPMSVIRLTSTNRTALAAAATHILTAWQGYSDPALQIRAVTAGTPHHTITPIARRVDQAYQLDLVLRDNQTSAEYPDGIFHPHPAVQHIKKENIGLIEVMGLAVLPARLKTELAEVEKFLLGQPNAMAPMHRPWAEQLVATQTWTPATAHRQLQQAVGNVFATVLENAGVFKRDAAGQAGFQRFVHTL